MKNFKTNLTEYKFDENSFNLVNEDVKIADKKFATKPTTFAKDAFRRFCKNKSSVVAAIILGILILMAIFVPVFSPYDIDRVSAPEQFLEPKLFKAGTGFWDGTVKYTKQTNLDGSPTGIVYDRVNDCPADFYKPAVMNMVVDTEPTYVNSTNVYGVGGYAMFENQARNGSTVNTLTSDSIVVTTTGNYVAETTLYDEDGIFSGVLGEYRVLLVVMDESNVKTEVESILLKDWSKDYGTFTNDLSYALVLAGYQTDATVKLRFELRAATDAYSYILVESCVLTADEDVSNYEDLSAVGFTDANAMIMLAQDGMGVFPRGYWSCTGRKGVYHVELYYCSFTYDTYEVVYGADDVIYGKSELDKLINAGLCTYDYTVGPESFVKLSDECPIASIDSQDLNPITGKLLQVTANVYRYSKMGYTSMPKYLLGTDVNGRDVLTKLFSGLRTSLLLGVCTFAFCFMFGLLWGSISGYFGGTVDIIMERFSDVLAGVPWIVVMTLCILHFGNNFLTFFLALCLTGWMGTAARTRSQFYRFKRQEYVLASRTLGSSDMRLIFKHILPNALGTIVTSSVLMIPSVIFSEATLSYLNLGLQGIPSFGVMLSENQRYINSHSYLIVWPSVVMALLMISFNLFGNGLRDAINPTLKGSD